MTIRAFGLAAGPMGGFDKAAVDAEFFAGTNINSQVLLNIGHPGAEPWLDRLPRLSFDDVAKII